MHDPGSELRRILIVGDSVNNFGQVSSGFIQDLFVSVLIEGGSLKAASTAGSSRMSEEQKSRETARQNEVSQEGTEPKRTDVERVEEAAQAIVRAIETGSDRFWEAQVEAQAKATKPKNPVVGTMLFVASTWVVFFAIFSGITLLWGRVAYDVGPFHTLERIGREQQQAETKKELGKFHVELGNSLLRVGEAKEAKAEFERARELDPFSQKAEMGILKSELFESVEAKDYAPAVMDRKLDELVEERADTHVYAFRGTLRYLEVVPDPYLPDAQQDELYQPALSDFQKAVKRNPSNAYAYSGMAIIYYDLGQFDDHLKNAEKAHNLAPRDQWFKHSYANALYVNKRYKDAIKEYEEIRYLDPQHMWANHDLAQVYRLTDDYDLYISEWYYHQFINMLEDEEVTSLAKNQGTFTFTTGPDSYPVYLSETPEMRYYAYYGIALTSYLDGQTKNADDYVNKAKAIQVDRDIKSEIEVLMKYDVKVLQEEQPRLSKQANDFSKKYLT
jgi:tetratricopeptide (TPR) repeat protein